MEYQVKKRSSETLHIFTVASYTTMRNLGQYAAIKDRLEKQSMQVYNKSTFL